MARLAPLDDAALDPRSRRVLDALPVRINLFTMLGYAPSLIGPVLKLGGAILDGMELPPRLRELAILRVAAVTETDYERHHHEPMARRAGLDQAAIVSAVTVGGRTEVSEHLDTLERLVVQLVDETLDAGAPSAQLVVEMVSLLGPAQLVELVCTVGYYSMIGQVLRALDVDIDESPTSRQPPSD